MHGQAFWERFDKLQSRELKEALLNALAGRFQTKADAAKSLKGLKLMPKKIRKEVEDRYLLGCWEKVCLVIFQVLKFLVATFLFLVDVGTDVRMTWNYAGCLQSVCFSSGHSSQNFTATQFENASSVYFCKTLSCTEWVPVFVMSLIHILLPPLVIYFFLGLHLKETTGLRSKAVLLLRAVAAPILSKFNVMQAALWLGLRTENSSFKELRKSLRLRKVTMYSIVLIETSVEATFQLHVSFTLWVNGLDEGKRQDRRLLQEDGVAGYLMEGHAVAMHSSIVSLLGTLTLSQVTIFYADSTPQGGEMRTFAMDSSTFLFEKTSVYVATKLEDGKKTRRLIVAHR